jgi:ribosomal silencing factor RsfS
MPNFPSRRALFAFARVISASKDIYRCPRCIRIQQNDGRRHTTRRFGISAFRHSETSNLSNSKDEGQLEDSPLLDPQTGGTKEATGSNVNEMPTRFRRKAPLSDYAFNAELEQILIGLEIAEVNIAELEDTLMDIEPTSTPFAKGKGLKRDFPEWYLQRDVQEEQDSMERFDERNEAVIDYEQPDNIRDESQDDNTDIVPWYLREQESDTSLLPQIDIQQTQLEKYPDLPFNSPPLLQPLVSRLFYDHHLQNIVLLDLRNRDPPPVWGSNTIMILATVRSERQLGGVAEATSKWLKQTAGVTPRTDGLPKRESLVIKRRRLRRKSLRKPGYLIAAPKPTTWVSMSTGYQGLVLQLFTEEGRIEYDLEGLWGDTRVVDAGVADMKPRKVRPGGIEEDEPVETSSSSVSQKKTLLQRNMEKEQKKWDKMKDAKAAKRRWTRQEKEQAKQRRAEEAASGFWQTPSRGRPSKMHSYSGDRQQRRQFHTTGTSLLLSS